MCGERRQRGVVAQVIEREDLLAYYSRPIRVPFAYSRTIRLLASYSRPTRDLLASYSRPIRVLRLKVISF